MSKVKLEFKPREEQVKILDFVKSSVKDKKKFMLIDAPTGVGKSYAAMMISEWYTREVAPKGKVDILTNSKLLQDQYVKDFKFLANLKGKDNYWCRTNQMSCGEASILNKATNKSCQACSHKIAQSHFVRNEVSLTNFHLMTAYSMYSPEILGDRGANLLIVDEAHGFEETFCDFISSTFSERSLKALDIWEYWMEKDLEKIQNITELAEYVSKTIIPMMSSKIASNIDEAKETRGKKKKLDLVKKADHLDKSMCKYNRFINDRESHSTNWSFEKDLDANGKIRLLVEPIWGNQYLDETFWQQYDHVIFMSGTILDQELFSFLMGYDVENSSYLALPCPFDAEKRPIIYLKFGKMSYYQKEESFKRAVPIINKILEKNSANKGIIHSGNYEFSRRIESSIKNPRLIVHESKTREESLSLHIRSEQETVIVSPSMINGIDLKDDLSRFQVILKVPFPNLISKKIKKRLETNSEWYSWKTLVDILQAYGRSIRNDQDWAETYILDECFDQVLNNQSLPQYFKEALKIKKLPK